VQRETLPAVLPMPTNTPALLHVQKESAPKHKKKIVIERQHHTFLRWLDNEVEALVLEVFLNKTCGSLAMPFCKV
jgi:hypothetical protein